MRRRWKRVVVLLVAGGLLLFLFALAWWLQGRLIYFPDPATPPLRAAPPGSEAVSFPTSDGLHLAGWFVPARGTALRGTVLVLNGNAGNRAHRTPLAEVLANEGLAVLLFDYRGFGGSAGTPSEAGLLADARAARAYLLARLDVDPTRLIYYGESLGSAVAVGLAAEHPPAALVLCSPFPSLVAVGRHHYWFLPVDLLLRDRYPVLEWLARVRVPTLVIAGAADQLIPPAFSRQVYEAAPQPDQFVLVPAADHVDPRLATGPEALTALRRLVTVIATG